MPGDGLFSYYQRDMLLTKQWRWNGQHYQRTAEAWLENLDQHRAEIIRVFERTYGRDQAQRWIGRWRLFFLACSELFGYRGGNEWWVSHYLFSRRGTAE